MDQDNQQLNTARKGNRFWNITLWVLIVALAIAVFVRAFVVSKVTVSGESMTSSYYNLDNSDHHNPALTFHDGDTVTVNKLKNPNRGDVVVFYKNPVKSKFLALFARGESIEHGGDYYKLIKRVVALGGDKLWLESLGDGKFKLVIQTPDGELLYEDRYVKNGETLDADCFVLSVNDYGGLGCLGDFTEQNPLVIPDGYFFAMGDNRANSDDSRGALGPVPLSQLFGVVV